MRAGSSRSEMAAPDSVVATPGIKALPGGSGPPLLLLHGYGSDSLSWLTLAPALATVARAFSLDLPGHGGSGMTVGDGSVETLAQAVAPLLEVPGSERYHLVGHSLGGGIALLLAARCPARVASLTLIAPIGLGQGVDAAFLRGYPSLQDTATTQALLQDLVVQPRLIGRPLVAGVLAQLGRPGSREALAAVGDAMPGSEEQAAAAACAVAAAGLPRLVLWGDQDRINRPDMHKLASFGGELRLIEAAGHLPHVEQPRSVGAIVAAFIEKAGAS